MYLTLLKLNHSRITGGWLANPYRIHQRLKMACPDDPRLLFRVDEREMATQILVQTHGLPDWAFAFNDFPVLAGLPEMKVFDPKLQPNLSYAFRLTANPVLTHDGKRIGLIKEEDQQVWLTRRMIKEGAELLRSQAQPYHLQRSSKSTEKDERVQTHLVVRFDGLLVCRDPEKLIAAVSKGIGPAKGYGCGLLSLARAN